MQFQTYTEVVALEEVKPKVRKPKVTKLKEVKLPTKADSVSNIRQFINKYKVKSK